MLPSVQRRNEDHFRHLEKVLHSLRSERLIVAVDANAQSSLWGSHETDKRGRKFEILRAFGLEVINEVHQRSFETRRESSFIDVSPDVPSNKPTHWLGWSENERSVTVPWRSSWGRQGQQMIAELRIVSLRYDGSESVRVWKIYPDQNFGALGPKGRSRKKMTGELQEIILEACKKSMPKKRIFRKSNPWWMEELTKMKKEVNQKRKMIQSLRESRNQRTESEIRIISILKQKYRKSPRQYNRAIKRTKYESWQKLSQNVVCHRMW